MKQLQLPFQLVSSVANPLQVSDLDANWPILVTGVGFGALVVIVAIICRRIFIRLRVRRKERSGQEAAVRERAAEMDRKETWRAEYVETGRLLDKGEKIVYRLREADPFNKFDIAELGIRPFRIKALRLAGRGDEALRKPLQILADLAEELDRIEVPDASRIISSSAAPEVALSEAYRLVFQQCLLVAEMAEEIERTRQILRREWPIQSAE
ncbi:hypothetical protein [Amycolatopsis sp. NPDC051716]|uniref:hypothetical protein n=1 Tax=Amycolatopsis sp. NPDC051716 TaxID=3155804 RepID=UPI00341E9B2C